MSNQTRSALNFSKSLLGWVVVLSYLIGLEYWLGWDVLLQPILGLNRELFVAALLLLTFSQLIRAMRLHDLLRDRVADAKPSFGLVFSISAVHNAVNHLLPSRAGEFSLPLLLRQHLSITLSGGSGGLVWLRLMDLQVLLLLGCVGASMRSALPENENGIGLVVFFGLASLCGVLMVLLVSRRNQIKNWLGNQSITLAQLLHYVPSTPINVSRQIAWTSLNWIIKFVTLAYLLIAFLSSAGNPMVTLGFAITAILGGELSAISPLHAPGGFGSYATGVVLFAQGGNIPVPELASAAISLHLVLFGTSQLVGALGWIFLRRVKRRR